jgi:hypothetical protein
MKSSLPSPAAAPSVEPFLVLVLLVLDVEADAAVLFVALTAIANLLR